MSPKLNNNKSNGKEIERAINIDIEADILKVAYSIPKLKDKFLNFMKEVWNQKCAPKQWCISYINALCKQKGSLESPNTEQYLNLVHYSKSNEYVTK